jgi:hypothetical protein
MPELAAAYGISPAEFWKLTNRELTVFLDHHKRASRGR